MESVLNGHIKAPKIALNLYTTSVLRCQHTFLRKLIYQFASSVFRRFALKCSRMLTFDFLKFFIFGDMHNGQDPQ